MKSDPRNSRPWNSDRGSNLAPLANLVAQAVEPKLRDRDTKPGFSFFHHAQILCSFEVPQPRLYKATNPATSIWVRFWKAAKIECVNHIGPKMGFRFPLASPLKVNTLRLKKYELYPNGEPMLCRLLPKHRLRVGSHMARCQESRPDRPFVSSTTDLGLFCIVHLFFALSPATKRLVGVSLLFQGLACWSLTWPHFRNT